MHSLPPVRAGRLGTPPHTRISSQIRRFGLVWMLTAMVVLAGVVLTRSVTNIYRNGELARSTAALNAAHAQERLSAAVERETSDLAGWKLTGASRYRNALAADRSETAAAVAAADRTYLALPAGLARQARAEAATVAAWNRRLDANSSATGGFAIERDLATTTTALTAHADTERGAVLRRAQISDEVRLGSTVIGLMVLLVGGALVLQKAWKLAVEADARRDREALFNRQIEAIIAWSARAKAATTRGQLIGYAHMAPLEAIGATCLNVAEGNAPVHRPHGVRPTSLMVDDAGTGLYMSVCFSEGRGDELNHQTLDLMLGHLAALWRTVLRQEELERAAGHDALTGLPNRRAFEGELRRRVSLSRRRDLGFTLAIVDLDHFKLVNDSMGHPEGDAVLRRAGEAIRRSLRGSDRIFRLGGEEFVLLLETTDTSGVEDILNRAREAVKGLGVEPAPGVLTSASIGWAVYPEDTDDRTALMHMADRALYEAKERGRDRVERASENRPRAA